MHVPTHVEMPREKNCLQLYIYINFLEIKAEHVIDENKTEKTKQTHHQGGEKQKRARKTTKEKTKKAETNYISSHQIEYQAISSKSARIVTQSNNAL